MGNGGVMDESGHRNLFHPTFQLLFTISVKHFGLRACRSCMVAKYGKGQKRRRREYVKNVLIALI